MACLAAIRHTREALVEIASAVPKTEAEIYARVGWWTLATVKEALDELASSPFVQRREFADGSRLYRYRAAAMRTA